MRCFVHDSARHIADQGFIAHGHGADFFVNRLKAGAMFDFLYPVFRIKKQLAIHKWPKSHTNPAGLETVETLLKRQQKNLENSNSNKNRKD